MKIKQIILGIGTMLGLVLLPNLQASELDKKTNITLREPMEIPGMVLPPGDYVVKRADGSLPNVIRFTNADETQVFATVHAIPTYRPRPTDEVEIVTEERPANSPEAIKKWFYPGDTTGAEFVYPRSSGNLLAAATTPSGGPPATSTTPSISSPPKEPAPAANSQVPLVERQTEQPVEIAQAQPPPTGATQAQPAPSRQQALSGQEQAPDQEEELPQTATSLTLASMLGGLAILGGAVLRKFSRRLG